MVPTHTLHTSILSIRTLFVRKWGYFNHGIAHYSISLLHWTSLVMSNSAQWSFCLDLLLEFDLLAMQSTYVEMFVSLKYLISKILEKCWEQKTIYLQRSVAPRTGSHQCCWEWTRCESRTALLQISGGRWRCQRKTRWAVKILIF